MQGMLQGPRTRFLKNLDSIDSGSPVYPRSLFSEPTGFIELGTLVYPGTMFSEPADFIELGTLVPGRCSFYGKLGTLVLRK